MQFEEFAHSPTIRLLAPSPLIAALKRWNHSPPSPVFWKIWYCTLQYGKTTRKHCSGHIGRTSNNPPTVKQTL